MQASPAVATAALPVGIDDATAAAYHYFGLRIRVLTADTVKDWAYDIIGERDTPPIPIIEIATAPHQAALFEALRIAASGGDAVIATRLLLGHLHQELSADRISTASTVTAALTLRRRNPSLEEESFDFLALDEDIYLSEDATEGFHGDLKAQALSYLATHGLLPGAFSLYDRIELRPIMPPADLPGGCSVRAATWIAAKCVRAHAMRLGLQDPSLDAFCDYLEAVMTTDDLVAWDNHGMTLAITGLGDALPAPLDRAPELAVLLQHAREISATQMYGAWEPAIVARHLKSCLDIAGPEILGDVPDRILSHRPLHHGWGDPLPRQPRPEYGPE